MYLSATRIIRLLDVMGRKGGRRPRAVGSLAPFGDSVYRVLITNTINRVQPLAGIQQASTGRA